MGNFKNMRKCGNFYLICKKEDSRRRVRGAADISGHEKLRQSAGACHWLYFSSKKDARRRFRNSERTATAVPLMRLKGMMTMRR